ncbi:MAG: Uncharacterized protein G01um10145_611 [Microgenomates group bacterium Gr01-1014_5]|nr:MAG: Uncharacterized protein G01um10145_611 [Microgenomates group bacterium Gr01-1014_5]
MRFITRLTILKITFFSGIFLLPFIVWPASPTPFEVPRVWVFSRWVELLVFLLVFNLGKIQNKPNVWLLFLTLAFFLIEAGASWFGVDWTKSLIGNYYRADGLITLLHSVILVFFLALFWTKSYSRTLAYVFLFSSALVSFWALDEFISLHFLRNLSIPNFSGAVGASFGQPNFLSGYLLVGLPFSFYAYTLNSGGFRALVRIGIILQVLAVFLTMSWGGILGLILLLLFYFLLSGKKLAVKISLGLVLSLTLAGALFYYAQSRPKFVAGFQEIALHPQSRERIIKNTLYAFNLKPFAGWGRSNFDYAFTANPNDTRYGSDVYVDRAHSVLAETAISSGVIGLTAYLSLAIFALVLILVRLRKGKDTGWNKALLISLLLYLFHSQTNVISINEEFFFWLIAGIVASNES